MKKIVLLVVVAMLFVATAAAQGKVTATTTSTTTTTTTKIEPQCKKMNKCHNVKQCQGNVVEANANSNNAVEKNDKACCKYNNALVGDKACDKNVQKSCCKAVTDDRSCCKAKQQNNTVK